MTLGLDRRCTSTRGRIIWSPTASGTDWTYRYLSFAIHGILMVIPNETLMPSSYSMESTKILIFASRRCNTRNLHPAFPLARFLTTVPRGPLCYNINSPMYLRNTYMQLPLFTARLVISLKVLLSVFEHTRHSTLRCEGLRWIFQTHYIWSSVHHKLKHYAAPTSVHMFWSAEWSSGAGTKYPYSSEVERAHNGVWHCHRLKMQREWQTRILDLTWLDDTRLKICFCERYSND